MEIRHSSCGLVWVESCFKKIKYTENEANKCSFGKWVISRCDYSHMGMAIRLLLKRYTLSNAKEDEKHEKQNVFTCTPYADFDMRLIYFYCFQSTAERLHYYILLF